MMIRIFNAALTLTSILLMGAAAMAVYMGILYILLDSIGRLQ